MEGGSLWQSFVTVVNALSNLYIYPNDPPKPETGGPLPAAPMNDAATISTSSAPFTLTIKRIRQTSDGIFGEMVNGNEKVCDTLENLVHAIPAGTYQAVKDFSPHLQYICPHLRVPARDQAAGGDSGIRVHIANYPYELQGCVAVGVKDGDALDNSKATFDKLMALTPNEFTVTVIDL